MIDLASLSVERYLAERVADRRRLRPPCEDHPAGWWSIWGADRLAGTSDSYCAVCDMYYTWRVTS